ncbi:MAG: tRNA glutamyl-Q(34) synthetase GluQRS, partial [Clostridia bacterium]|nr:tRNA glutamyl-Q(34) synthetase GluQRS [Clostridia bacterium]
MADMPPVCGRFAPSPSGRMHAGNVFCALLAWLSARSQGGRMVLRIEDLDPDRCTRAYAAQLEDDLRWLGLDWDEGPVLNADGTMGLIGEYGPYFQTERIGMYQKYIQ